MKKNHFKFKALIILLSSCHFIAHHCQQLSSSSPTWRVFPLEAPHTACLTLNDTRCPLGRGRHCCQVVSGSTSHSQTRTWRPCTGSHSSLLGHHFVKIRCNDNLEHSMVLFFFKRATNLPCLPH